MHDDRSLCTVYSIYPDAVPSCQNHLLKLHVTIFSGLCDSRGTSEHHGGDTFTNSRSWNTICQRSGKYMLLLKLKINWQSSKEYLCLTYDQSQGQIIEINNRIKSI
jgi:hypothetical protein